MRITPEIVAHTAALARLDLSVWSAEEVAELQAQLDAILAHVAVLEGLDTTGVPPTTHAVPIALPLRADEPQPGPGRERILANAPAVENGFYVVPRVIAE